LLATAGFLPSPLAALASFTFFHSALSVQFAPDRLAPSGPSRRRLLILPAEWFIIQPDTANANILCHFIPGAGAPLITATQLLARPKGTDREPSPARSAFDCTTSIEWL
jgi:hypothetical protein